MFNTALIPSWKETARPARLEELLPGNVVRCHLSPRNCLIKEGGHGFCGVRANQGGRLVTLNYGKSVHLTEETIETEAVNHFAPGERILSLGNIGCMLNCSYCHNWKTSQAKYVSDSDVYYYTPEQLVETAQRHGIRVLSWTYNDPVVWHEFVRETAALAKKVGLINLYKSAFFITPEAVDELLPYIDIFSISIKSLDPEYYKRLTTGWLQPVLDATKQVYKAGKHVEVSTLMVTDISDDEGTARKVTEWVLTQLDSSVPTHFVRFHPDYKMREGTRTPIDRLIRARETAMQMGLEHVYLGNVYDTPFTNTLCARCGAELVTRYGLHAQILGLDDRGHCKSCGRNAHFKLLGSKSPIPTLDARTDHVVAGFSIRKFQWHGDIRSLHVQVMNQHDEPVSLYRRVLHGGLARPWQVLQLMPKESYRFIIAKGSPDETGTEVALPPSVQSNLHEVFDRAHFPTIAIEQQSALGDVAPLPIFPGRQVKLTNKLVQP